MYICGHVGSLHMWLKSYIPVSAPPCYIYCGNICTNVVQNCYKPYNLYLCDTLLIHPCGARYTNVVFVMHA